MFKLEKKVCIANITTGEVLRVLESVAAAKVNADIQENKSARNWYYCEKKIYQQYLESQKKDSKIPAPRFHKEIKTVDKNNEPIKKIIIINVNNGTYISMRGETRGGRKYRNCSHSNKSKTFTYQHIYDDNGKRIKTIRHRNPNHYKKENRNKS